MMPNLPRIATLAPGLLAGLAACTPTGGKASADAPKIDYRGVETRLLDDNLVEFRVALSGEGVDGTAADDYARCAAAQYAEIRGYGFARHVRTNVNEEGGIWRADAVYTISPALPQGLKTIDAEVTVGDCADRGIPTV
jgi:hypothetical protein